MRTEFQNPTCTPPQLRPVQAAYHAFHHTAKCGDEGGTKIEKSRISSSDFSEVEITTNNGIAKNSAVPTKKA
jgi:hypothetical protein